MKALSQEEIQKICNLYKIYGNLREVSLKSSRSIGAIHKYLSSNGLIKSHNIIKALSTNDNRLIGVYIGLWLGDGTQYRDRHNYTLKICSNKEDIYLNNFIQNLIFKIFNKTTTLFKETNTKRAYIKFHSRFIFNFIYNYVTMLEGKKTYSVRLKEKTNSYNQEFLEGCLLGLTLSDGSLKNNFVFSVASEGLAINMKDILIRFGFNPHFRIQKRINKANAYIVYLNIKESQKLKEFLNKIVRDVGLNYSFHELKYGPAQI